MSTVNGGWQGPGIYKDSSLVIYIDPSSPNCYYLQSGSVVQNMGNNRGTFAVAYYTGSESSASFNTVDKTFDYRFRLSGGGGLSLATNYTIQTTIFYPTGSPNTSYPFDMIFTTQVGSGTGIGIFLHPTLNQAWLFLGGGTRLTLNNVPRNQWFNLAFTKEDSLLRGYYNGALVGTSSAVHTNPYDPIFFGSNGGSLQLQNYYIRAANLIAYSRALSQQEILQNSRALGARVGL